MLLSLFIYFYLRNPREKVSDECSQDRVSALFYFMYKGIKKLLWDQICLIKKEKMCCLRYTCKSEDVYNIPIK